jgi:hypothetical protein
MNSILQPPPERDEYGLPLLPAGTTLPDISNADMEEFMAGNFGAFGLPPPPSMPTAAEAQAEAQERATEMLADWRTLEQILERFEAALRKRWTKKTKASRTALLLEAWLGMPRIHRPDFRALEKEGPQLKLQGTKLRESYVWPYLNVEDLVKGKAFLLL